ncbi:MAG: hypothetical protein H7247_09745 [Polaromonas sp.]|nr:hypothetical protein [Gemmatimonadaceae bacterium]
MFSVATSLPATSAVAAFPGQVQPGSTCQLGAQSGLPSIAIPIGFTGDGLPVSVELLGKGFTDARLVSLAYAFEQSGPRRRAPSTTPALVNGVAPVARPITVSTRAGSTTVTTQLTVDAVHNALRWQVHASGASQLAAVVLRRRGGGVITGPASGTSGSAPVVVQLTIPDDAVRVVARLMGPDRTDARGSLPLSYADRVAFAEGRLSVAVMSSTGAITEQVVR